MDQLGCVVLCKFPLLDDPLEELSSRAVFHYQMHEVFVFKNPKKGTNIGVTHASHSVDFRSDCTNVAVTLPDSGLVHRLNSNHLFSLDLLGHVHFGVVPFSYLLHLGVNLLHVQLHAVLYKVFPSLFELLSAFEIELLDRYVSNYLHSQERFMLDSIDTPVSQLQSPQNDWRVRGVSDEEDIVGNSSNHFSKFSIGLLFVENILDCRYL